MNKKDLEIWKEYLENASMEAEEAAKAYVEKKGLDNNSKIAFQLGYLESMVRTAVAVIDENLKYK